MRCLQVVEPGLNGVFRHVEGLLDYLMQQKGVTLALAFSDLRGSDALEKLVHRVRRQGPALNMRVPNAPSLRDIGASTALMGLARHFRPDIIHCHSSKAGALGRALSLTGERAQHFYTPNAYFGLSGEAGLRTLVFDTAECVFGRVGRTINVSKKEAAFARDRLSLRSSSLLRIPNAVDCEKFHPASRDDRARMRIRLDLPVGAWVFGSVGRYSEQKDPRTLYETVGRVLSRAPNVWFAHLGDGELFDEISAFLDGKSWASRVVRVRYDGQPADFYRTLDALVLSSRYEGLPLSAIEALATGLPLALTKCPGCDEFADMGLDGVRWGTVGCPGSLAEAVEAAMLLKPDLLNHRSVAEALFSPAAVYGRILSAYRGVCSERDGSVI